MPITINDAELEARVRAAAAELGTEPDQYVMDVVAEALLADAESKDDWDPDDMTPEEIEASREGIRRGLEDAAAGRVKPLSQVMAEARERHGLDENWLKREEKELRQRGS